MEGVGFSAELVDGTVILQARVLIPRLPGTHHARAPLKLRDLCGIALVIFGSRLTRSSQRMRPAEAPRLGLRLERFPDDRRLGIFLDREGAENATTGCPVDPHPANALRSDGIFGMSLKATCAKSLKIGAAMRPPWA